MDMPITMDQVQVAETKTYRTPAQLRIVAAQQADGNAVVALCWLPLPSART
jgi:hypothetical protein